MKQNKQQQQKQQYKKQTNTQTKWSLSVLLSWLGVFVILEISKVELQSLDISNNRIKELPHEFRHIETLETINLQNNPLESPPAHVSEKQPAAWST